jgi:CRP-like cAMP-binding protein
MLPNGPGTRTEQLNERYLTSNAVAHILRNSGHHPTEHEAGAKIVEQGKPTLNVYLIVEGAAKITHVGSDSKERVLGIRTAGVLLGATPVLTEDASSVTATALTRCVLMPVPCDTFRHLVTTTCSFAAAVAVLGALEGEAQLSFVASMESTGAQQRLQSLCRCLINLGAGDEARPFLRAPLKHYEIAQLIHVTPEHLSRLLAKMEIEGAISRRKGWIYLKRCNGIGSQQIGRPRPRQQEGQIYTPVDPPLPLESSTPIGVTESDSATTSPKSRRDNGSAPVISISVLAPETKRASASD